jgi:hypothetical protein
MVTLTGVPLLAVALATLPVTGHLFSLLIFALLFFRVWICTANGLLFDQSGFPAARNPFYKIWSYQCNIVYHIVKAPVLNN